MECPLPHKKKQNVNHLLLLQLHSLAFLFGFVLKFGGSLNFNSANIFRMQVIKSPIKNDEDYFHWVLMGILPRNYSKMPIHKLIPLKNVLITPFYHKGFCKQLL